MYKYFILLFFILFISVTAFAQTFVEEDDIDDGGSYNACEVSADGAFIHTATASIGIRAHTFDGATLTNVGSRDDGDSAEDLWIQGIYILLANFTGGLWQYTFNGTVYALVDSDDQGGNYMGVWSDGTYIYVVGNTGLMAYSGLGGTLTHIVTQAFTSGTGEAVYGYGSIIHTATDTGGLEAFSFNGSAFTSEDTIDDGGTYEDVDVSADGTFVYAACGVDGFRAYGWDGSDYTLLDTIDAGGAGQFALGVDVVGDWIMCSDNTNGLYARTFDGASWADVDDIQFAAGAGACNESAHDGTYTYAAVLANGLYALSGFETAQGQVIIINSD
jgi:hypothetical protein